MGLPSVVATGRVQALCRELERTKERDQESRSVEEDSDCEKTDSEDSGDEDTSDEDSEDSVEDTDDDAEASDDESEISHDTSQNPDTTGVEHNMNSKKPLVETMQSEQESKTKVGELEVQLKNAQEALTKRSREIEEREATYHAQIAELEKKLDKQEAKAHKAAKDMGLLTTCAEESEAREANYQEKVAVLEKKLQDAEEAVKNMPEDHEQRLQDLQMAINSRDFYRKLFDSTKLDVTKLEDKLKTANIKQVMIEENKLLILRLQEECAQHKLEYERLFDENSLLRSQLADGESKIATIVELKQCQIDELEKLLDGAEEREREKDAQIVSMEEEHERIQETYIDVIDRVEGQTAAATNRLNVLSARRVKAEKIQNTIHSELVPLRAFYERSVRVTKRLVQESSALAGVQLYDILKPDLKAVAEQYDKVKVIREALDSDVEDPVRDEIHLLGKLADELHMSLASLAARESVLACRTASNASRPSSTSDKSSTSTWTIAGLPKIMKHRSPA